MHFASLAFKVEESASKLIPPVPPGEGGLKTSSHITHIRSLEDFSQDADERKEGTDGSCASFADVICVWDHP